MERPKCIIIGSGLGGLSSGIILAKHGYQVTVLEQGVQIGGCLQCFSRGGVRFETGMHFVGSADEGEVLHDLLSYLEVLPELHLSRLDTTSYNIISLAGEHFCFANGAEPFIETLAQSFPQQKDQLRRYMQLVGEVASASSVRSMSGQTSNPSLLKYQLLSIGEVLDEVIDDPLLRDVLCGDASLYAGVREKTPFALHAFLADFYNRSAFRIAGGSDQIATLMQKTLARYGGEVRTRSRVTSVLCNESKAIGVEINGSEFLLADLILSDIHPQALFPMVQSKALRPAFRSRIAEIPNTPAVFSLFLKFKDGAMPYMNSNFFSYRANHPWNCENYTSEDWPKGYLYMHLCDKQETNTVQKFARSGVVLTYQHASDLATWKDTTIGHRGADYEAYKKQLAERLLDQLERDFPHVRESIDCYYTATALTYRDYTSSTDGSMYGVMKDVAKGPDYRVSYKTKVPNLLLVGQNVNSHGILGVLVGTIMACSSLIGGAELANDIYKR